MPSNPRRPNKRRSLISSSKWLINFLIVLLLLGFVALTQADDWLEDNKAEIDHEWSTTTKPLDILNSSVIAYSLAALSHYQEASWIETQVYNSRNLASQNIGGIPVVAKPRVINSTTRTRQDISHYVVSPGDTLAGLANAFNISSDSIRWSNGVEGDYLRYGRTILLPPPGLNGIVHQIRQGDTLKGLSKTYAFSEAALLSFNDLQNIGDLEEGELIFIPDARPATSSTVVPSFLAAAAGKESLPSSFASRIGGIKPCATCRPVVAGTSIGKLGNTGWSTGPHLHLEIITLDGRRIDPWVFIKQHRLPWPVDQKVRRVTQIYHSEHKALDVGDREGVDILSVADGQMIFRGCLWLNTRFSNFGVIVRHSNYYSLSIHLQTPNNPIYDGCKINRRSQYGVPSVDYTATI